MQTSTLPKQNVPVLLVSARRSDRASLHRILRRPAWKLLVSPNYREALTFLRQNRIPVVICDNELPDGNWRLLLDSLADLTDPPNLIVSSRLADERLWAEVLNLGGYDVLPTPFDTNEVLRVTFMAWQFWERQRGLTNPNAKLLQTEVTHETVHDRYSACRGGR
jgi:DNA-binding response OmpR family regulator